jgi:putative transposase
MKNIKGLSSHWVNQQNFIKGKFAWQTGYGAFSVSESMLEKVYKYILNQEEHHKKISYENELRKFLELNGLLIEE